MKREHIIRKAEKEFSSGGYATVLASNMHTIADIFAQGRGRKFIIKAVHDIDSVTKQEASALSRLAHFMDAEPIILGSFSGSRKLSENVSRYRFDVRCVTPDTLFGLAQGEAEMLASKSFGIKTVVDSARLRNLRQLSNLSVRDLAKRTGISASTLYKHEEGAKYAAVSTVLKIEKTLAGRIRAQEYLPRSRAETPRPGKLARTGMQVLELHSAPFDMVAKNRNYYEISRDANSRTLLKRAELFKAIRETFDSNYPFFLSQKRKGRIHGVPVISSEQMLEAKSEDDLLEIVYD